MNCAQECLWNKTGNYWVGCNVVHSGWKLYYIQYSCSYFCLHVSCQGGDAVQAEGARLTGLLMKVLRELQLSIPQQICLQWIIFYNIQFSVKHFMVFRMRFLNKSYVKSTGQRVQS